MDLYEKKYRKAVKKYDQDFHKAYEKCLQSINSRRKNNVTRSSYGMLEWGDGFHWALAKGDSRPINLMWDGNYYGFPHMMCAQWARTGTFGYFDMFQTHARHVADVHTVHYAPDSKWVGANRYCPPPEHVRFHKHNDPDKNPVYISNTFNHHKAQSLFERWYLLADHRMLDVIDEIGGFIMRYHNADNDPRQPRGPGHLLMTLAELYRFHGGTEKWEKRYKKAFEASHRNHKNYKINYQHGFWLEGIRRYYEVTEDERALKLLQKYADRMMNKSNATSCNRAHVFGFLYGETGKEAYRTFGAKSVQNSRPGYGNLWKDFASNMRSGMYMLYWLAKEHE